VGGVPKRCVNVLLEHTLCPPGYETINYATINFPSTAFGFYRDETELRGVCYTKPEVTRLACSSPGIQ
jgi:hypothetical protein